MATLQYHVSEAAWIKEAVIYFHLFTEIYYSKQSNLEKHPHLLSLVILSLVVLLTCQQCSLEDKYSSINVFVYVDERKTKLGAEWQQQKTIEYNVKSLFSVWGNGLLLNVHFN